ncbi:5-keto-4-deoxy-D-glucarate aldolase [bioreactor metagenome]|uniref:5-keto-4-deoxy-D-glucarate aldolase n=1 Tax=bioreactor metagenome TaxID=1076179 RepID=A0A644Z0D7_9ZZZZ
MKQNNLKARMQRGETVYGMFLNSGSSIAAEIMGLSGFDFILIDSEHGPTGVLENRELIMAAEYRNTAPIVRVPNSSSDTILRMLDVGAHGILVPRVNTREEAEKVAKACRYYPRGTRGVAGTRASDYGFTPLSYYFPLANERTLVGVQCEDIACLPELEEIAATDGVDMVFVGPYDLSSSMGALGQVSYQDIKDVVDRVIDVTRRHGKLSGIFTKDPAEAKQYAKMGIDFIVVGTDIQSFAGACREVISSLKDM